MFLLGEVSEDSRGVEAGASANRPALVGNCMLTAFGGETNAGVVRWIVECLLNLSRSMMVLEGADRH